MIQLIILKNLIFYHLNVLFEVKQKNIDSVATYNVAVGRFAEQIRMRGVAIFEFEMSVSTARKT